MIEISSTLQAAAEAESRAPIFGVDVIQKRLDLRNAELSPSHAVHRVDACGSYWVATAYNQLKNTLYSKRISTLLSTDWESGWVTVASGLPNSYVHDFHVSGNDVYLYYYDLGGSSEPELWQVISSDNGATWGSPALVRDAGYSSAWEILCIGVASGYNVWWAAGADGDAAILTKSTYSAGWTHEDFDDKISSETFDFGASFTYDIDRQMFARTGIDVIDDYVEAVIFNSAKGFISDDIWEGVFALHNYGVVGSMKSSPIKRSLGCLETDLDYKFQLRGLSKDTFGGYYIGGMCETYNNAADKDAYTVERELFICRTMDGVSYQLIPISGYMPGGIYPALEFQKYFAGVVEDDDGTIVFVITDPSRGFSGIYYTDPGWLTGYDTGQAIEDDVLGNISINRSVMEIANSKITLSNESDAYTANTLVTEGNIVRVSAGYKTASGDELQDRFTGEIVKVNRSFPPDETMILDVYDTLYPTRLAAGRVHVLMGQNLFRADFSETDADKAMVHQAGIWAVLSSRLQQTEKEVNASTICGFDPDDSYAVVAKVRADTSITDIKMGVVVGYDPQELTDVQFSVVCYNETTDNLEYGYVDVDGDYNLTATLASSLGWSADTDYYLKVDRLHGHARTAFYKTSATGAWTAVDIDEIEGMGLKVYPGLFCYVPTSGTGVSFSYVYAASNRAPMNGSDMMKYIAATCGINTDEKVAIYDDFSAVGFTSDWQEGPDGIWDVGTAWAEGEGTLAAPAEACVITFTASDVMATAFIRPQITTNYAGVTLRSDCDRNRYEAMIAQNGYQIAKVVDGVRTILDYQSTVSWIATTVYQRVTFMANGPWLALFVGGYLYGLAYDTDLTSGYTGIIAACADGNESIHTAYNVDGFYTPVPGVVTVNPKNNFIEVMKQIAGMTPSGQFFCNEAGDLRWGAFPENASADLDVEDIIIDRKLVRGLDKITTVMALTGDLLYANARVEPWAVRLSRHIFKGEDNKHIKSRHEALNIAFDDTLDTHRISETDLEIRANPALELCDIITVSNGITYLYDTFTDINSTDLDDHTPDIDLEGYGWQAPDVINQFYVSNNFAYGVGVGNDQINTIDIGLTDFILEADIAIYNIGVIGTGYPVIGFRMSDYENGQYFIPDSHMGFMVSGDLFPQSSFNANPGWGTGYEAWIHIKIICNGPNVACVYQVGTNPAAVIYSASMPAASAGDTLIGLFSYAEDQRFKLDNLIVYTTNVTNQILVLEETIGKVYNMEIPSLIGEKEYW